MTGIYFCAPHKNKRKHNQHFKLLYFKLNSHLGTSNSISACRKLDLLLINSICLVVSSLEMQGALMQTKVRYKYFYSVSKETFTLSHKPSNVVTAKNVSSSVHVIDNMSH